MAADILFDPDDSWEDGADVVTGAVVAVSVPYQHVKLLLAPAPAPVSPIWNNTKRGRGRGSKKLF